ncbi:MAG: anthranilate phosphoribosyltransferase [Candidatus Omnitrophica bacterium]|nr:anthranilate phosphoribosyltransferase [Candidatus Omnitrophota bacterium]
MEEVMDTIMSGEAIKEEVASFLIALREKGPTVAEITGAARIMRRFVVGIKSDHKVVLDTCGTGGDKSGTFNISTCTAFVVAGAGVAVAKHGNRSVSSKCGSADILEGLGVNLDIPAERVEQCLNDVGIAFLFAQRHHPAMKNVAAIRKELGVETIFNVLGPLTNPAQATHQMIGVYHRRLVEPMARVLSNLGLRRALVVHGSDGLDEITTTGPTHFCEYNGEDLLSYDISPEEIGLPVASPEDLKGGNLDENLRIFSAILDGEQGPRRDIVLLNAAYALYLSEKVTSIEDGLRLAAASVDDGRARAKLEALKEFTHAE